MDDKIAVDLDKETYDALTRQAIAHGHDVAEEVRSIVLAADNPEPSQADWIGRARAIRAMTAPGSIHVETWKLIRASRDWDH